MKKVAIVTGGANGIGKGIVEKLIYENFFVVIIDIDEELGFELERQNNSTKTVCKFIKTDVSNPEHIKNAVELTKKIGKIEVLINNAGYSKDDPIEKISIEDWDNLLNVHLRSSFLFIQEVVPVMKQNTYGRIINISSISALGDSERASYCAAKAGMHGLIKSVACELGSYGITANVIAPGLIVTNMTKKSAARKKISLEEYIENAAKTITVNRVGYPKDIANAVSFFADKNSGFITGQILYITGNP
ncbi:SDR family NAD(P)-dependent oxidoreductase [Chryseobacterium sp. Marseille-Q3244]|uniref:SDR family NAD(P)-dependent oxidoreductase n=1 Tax=Chryseobacterium sp. Marseille-Q3244 TaxID=2758092 RepID=UPI00202436D5|nr:SDR family NAD(P)-dependent oxidoreductase [Chryseobacterium sp. Marseille-Q3244]